MPPNDLLVLGGDSNPIRWRDALEREVPNWIQELTTRMQRNDEIAWREAFENYQPRLRRHLLSVCRGDEDAVQEALQETWIRVVRYIRMFDDEEVFWCWLSRVARSAVVDRSRKRTRYWAMLDRWIDRRAGSVESSPTIDSARLGEAVNSLDPDDALLIRAHYFEGQTYAEIAAGCGNTARAIESRMSRLRSRLKATLERNEIQ